MNWKQRPDGDLDLSVLTGFELAAGKGGEIALRLEHAVVQEQLTGDRSPEAVQMVMTFEAAKGLAMQILATAAKAKGADGH